MQNRTEDDYAEWDRRGLGRIGQKEAMHNGAEGDFTDSGIECLT